MQIVIMFFTECTTDGQIFRECGTPCPPVCHEEQPSLCTKQCVRGCQCPYGTSLDRDRDRCVMECGPPGLLFFFVIQYF